MQYPLISEYIEAIRSAEDNFDKLSNLRPVLDSDGNPVMSSGNFAVVFKMEDVATHRLFAVKCFIKEQEGRGERYALIAEELQYVSSPYLLHVRYLERELFVSTAGCDEEEFPVLVMDWVEGQPLDVYLKQHLNNQYELEMLAYRFCKMGAWLLSQPFAHGDLKPDNILVREDGSLVLVDYDGMYVSAMEGQTAAEMGSPDFRHPLRTEKDFNEHIDDFSIATIALSLKAISLDSQLYSQYAAADRLLFSAADYRDIGKSIVLQAIIKLMSDIELSTILSLFLLALSKNGLSMITYRTFLLDEPERPVEILSTEVTNEELNNVIEDEYGAEYTADGQKLIRVPNTVTAYIIKKGTKVIGNNAFWGCEALQSISIPNSVTHIGSCAFGDCLSIKSITIPNSVVYIGYNAFLECRSLKSATISDSISNFGHGIFEHCYSLQHFNMPIKLLSIGQETFLGCSSLQSIEIPNCVTRIGYGAFGGCSTLQSITIPNSVTIIEDSAFAGCSSLKSITIPESVNSIGSGAFSQCSALESIIIPPKVTCIKNCTFQGCKSLQTITIPDSVKGIGNSAFRDCKSLKSITIPDSVINIGIHAFWYCKSLKSITIPNSVTSIGEEPFALCSSLHTIKFKTSAINIGMYYLLDCISLDNIYIPKGSKGKFVKMLGQFYENILIEE